jgi:hypothetical protein
VSAYLSCLLCSRSRSGRRSGLWDITKAETTLGNVPNAGKRMSASRARSSLRAMLRLAKERRPANNGLATRASCCGWHLRAVPKSAAHYQYNAVAPAIARRVACCAEAEQIFHPCATPPIVPVQIRKARCRLLRKTFSAICFAAVGRTSTAERSQEPFAATASTAMSTCWRMDSTTERTRKGRIDSFGRGFFSWPD